MNTISRKKRIDCYISEDGDVSVWDHKGTDYSSYVKHAVACVPKGPNWSQRIIEELREVILGYAAGFDITKITRRVKYNPATDNFLEELKRISTPDRELTIDSYGTRLMVSPPPSEHTFDVAVLHGKTSKEMTKLRGIDPVVQHTIRIIPAFEPLVTEIVTTIESRDLHKISVTCKGGRHRSVFVSEYLKLIYPNTKISHLTIE